MQTMFMLLLPLLLHLQGTPGHIPGGDADTADRMFYVSFYFAPPPANISKAAPVYQGFAASSDRGEQWANRGWITSSVSAIAVDPADTKHVLLGTDYGVLASSNAGEHWKQISGWDMPAVLDVAFRNGTYWAATSAGVFVSSDNGVHWEARNNGLRPAPNATYVSTILQLPRNILIATGDGVFRSTDEGASWMRSGLEGLDLAGIVAHPRQPSHLAAFSPERGIWISSDGGRSWIDRSEGLKYPQVKCAAFDPREPSTLLIGTQRVGVMRSSDLGRTWELSSGGLTNFNITALQFDPDMPDRCYAGAENGSFISTNRGKIWQPFSIRLGYVSDIEIK